VASNEHSYTAAASVHGSWWFSVSHSFRVRRLLPFSAFLLVGLVRGRVGLYASAITRSISIFITFWPTA
jgi:hypothetical protein